MPTLKGKWYFKQPVNVPNLGKVELQFSNSGYEYELLTFYCPDSDERKNSIGFAEFNTAALNGIAGHNAYKDDRWMKDEYRTIDVIGAQEVSEEFYNWFTQNAVPLNINGTWRFNKTLIFPEVPANELSSSYWVAVSTHFNEVEGSCVSQHYDYGLEGFGYLELCYNGNFKCWFLAGPSTWTDYYFNLLANGDWLSEKAQILTFKDVTLDPDFAIWFYENAHPTKIVLCSEAYVAEIAHNIRQIKRTTQRYAVKNLANEIRNLYINANEEVY